MKLGQLKKAITAVRGCISQRPPMEILGMIRIESTGSEIKLSANDLDKAITVSFPYEGEKFTKLISARSLGQTAKGKAAVEVSFGEDKIQIGAVRISYDKADPDEFPVAPGAPSKVKLIGNLDISQLNQVLRAASADQTRYIMNSVFIGRGAMVATDGRRLIVLDNEKLHKDEVIIPSATVQALYRARHFLGQSPKFTHKSNRMYVSEPGIEFSSKLVEGTYPNYKQVIPPLDENWTSIKVTDKVELIDFLQRCTTLGYKKQAVTVNMGGDTLKIRSNYEDIEIELKDQQIYGEAKSVCFDPGLMVDLIEDSDIMYLKDEYSIAYGKNDKGDMIHLLMPLRMS